jgi:hypothetical protein
LLLGFNSQCVVDVDHALQDFDKLKFLRDISWKTDFFRPHTNDIQHPTLRFMHKWLGFTMFPRLDTRPVRIDDLKLLYAMVKRRKVSPVKLMIHQWLEVFTLTGDVECTSLVTRIAQNLGLRNNALVSFIDEKHLHIDFEYFTQMLKKREDGKIVMMYHGYTTEISLPNRNLDLYTMDSFTFDLQEKDVAPRRSASARLTHAPQPHYYGDDPIPKGPAYTSYAG